MPGVDEVEFYAPEGWKEKHPRIMGALVAIPLTFASSLGVLNYFVIDRYEDENADLKNEILVCTTTVTALRNENTKLSQQVNVQSENQSGGITTGSLTVDKLDPPDRELTESLKEKLLQTKTISGKKCVYVDDAVWDETVRFAKKIRNFLLQNGIPATISFAKAFVVPDPANPVTPEGVLVVMDKPTDDESCSMIVVYTQRR